jgi:transcriptional regulator with XRE-family HTH domain
MTAKTPRAHVLRTIRKLYGYSQQKLATLVGCSLSTVKFVETGRLRPSADLADRIRVVTGLDPQQLIGNFSPNEPRDPCNVRLTEETIKLRQEGGGAPDDEQTREQVDGSSRLYAVVIETLLDTSVRKGKLWALRLAYQTAMTKLIDDFDLAKDFRRVLLARYGTRDPWFTGGYNIEKDLYTIVNAPLFETRRKAAQLQRDEFYSDIQKLPMRKPSGKSAA